MIVIFFSDIDSPKNLVTEQVTENTATISWDPVQAVIDRYLVRYTSADGDSREVPVGKEQSSTVLTGLRPGMEYTVHVWAQKGDRESRKADTKAPTGNRRGKKSKLGFFTVGRSTAAELGHCCFCGPCPQGLWIILGVYSKKKKKRKKEKNNNNKLHSPKERTKHNNGLSTEQSHECLKLFSKACVFNDDASQL